MLELGILTAGRLVLAQPAWAAPSISRLSGTLTHAQLVTIDGAAFGSRLIQL